MDTLIKRFATGIGLVAALFAFSGAGASELDHDPNAPKGILVRVDTSGHETTYKADQIPQSKDDSALQSAIQATATDGHMLTGVVETSRTNELDSDSSTAAWYRYGYGGGWNRYNWRGYGYGSYYNYYPYYYYPSYYSPYYYYPYYYQYSYPYNNYYWYWYW